MVNPVILSRDVNGGYHHQETLSAGQTSEPVLTAPSYPTQTGYKPISIAVFPSVGASARIEVSLSPITDVQNGAANWIAWSAGDSAVNRSDVIQSAVSAIRCVSTGGSTVWEILS